MAAANGRCAADCGGSGPVANDEATPTCHTSAVVVAEAAHMVIVEQPRRTAELIRSFIARY